MIVTSPAPNPNTHGGDIGSVVVARFGAAKDAIGHFGAAIPAVEAKYAVGLGDHMPSLDVTQTCPTDHTRFDMSCVELRFQLADLTVTKRHHFVLTIRTGLGLLSSAPGTGTPPLSSTRIDCRSSLERDLGKHAGVAANTVSRFENGMGTTVATLSQLQRALEEAGVVFIPADESGGPGIRLKRGRRFD